MARYGFVGWGFIVSCLLLVARAASSEDDVKFMGYFINGLTSEICVFFSCKIGFLVS